MVVFIKVILIVFLLLLSIPGFELEIQEYKSSKPKVMYSGWLYYKIMKISR